MLVKSNIARDYVEATLREEEETNGDKVDDKEALHQSVRKKLVELARRTYRAELIDRINPTMLPAVERAINRFNISLYLFLLCCILLHAVAGVIALGQLVVILVKKV